MASAMVKNLMSDNVPLSRFRLLAAQLESIVASAAQQSPDPLLCFVLLSDLISTIEEENFLTFHNPGYYLRTLFCCGKGDARTPYIPCLLWVHVGLCVTLASVAMAKIISKGDGISIYPRASSLQGFLSDGREVNLKESCWFVYNKEFQSF